MQGLRLITVEQIYAWAEQQPTLPLDLRWAERGEPDQRLYSPGFYTLALHATPRAYAVGGLVRMQAADGETPLWIVELEYQDEITPQRIEAILSAISATIPSEIGGDLRWVARSPQQLEVADQMIAAELAGYRQIVRYSEIIPQGTVEVYNDAIAAGRLLYVGADGAGIADIAPDSIIITEHVPDWLPQAQALITSDPQTPLAHINILAQNRGMPNASQAGVHLDPELRQAARVHAPALVYTTADNRLEVMLLTTAQYKGWQDKLTQSPIAVPAVPIDWTPTTMDIADLARSIRTEEDLDRLRPIIGGKSAGLVALYLAARTKGVSVPPDALAITVRPFIIHSAQFGAQIDAVLANPEFIKSARARMLLLQGREAYDEWFSDEADGTYADGLQAAHPPGSTIGELIDVGGLVGLLRSQPIDRVEMIAIDAALREHFGDYALTAGLRFRSSSSVEDIEGFNGAGLYDSNTGFFDPTLQADEDDHDHTTEWAILKTWSSYWGFEAFEERRLAQIDHRSGAMGVSVHATFTDDIELNNGVATITILPRSADDRAVLEVNVQAGADAVTNPDGSAQPERLRVILDDDGNTRIERLARSTLRPDVDVLDDDAVGELFTQIMIVAEQWLARVNQSLPAEQRNSTVVLDLEFKTVDRGWPAKRSGLPVEPSRLVIRQVRSLDPGLRSATPEVRALPIARDLLARATSVKRVICTDSAGLRSERVELLTNPSASPDFGFATAPFVVEIGAQQAAAGAACVSRALLSTPQQYLFDLLADR